MSKEIHFSEIATEITTKIDISISNQIIVSFELDGKVENTDAESCKVFFILVAEGQSIIWKNTIKMSYDNGQSLEIKLYNDKFLLGSGVINVSSTVEEQKNTIEIQSETQELIAKISFKSVSKLVEEPSVKTKTQKTIPLQDSPQKTHEPNEENENEEPKAEPELVETNFEKPKNEAEEIHNSQKIKNQPQEEEKPSPKKNDIKLSDRPTRKMTEKSEKKPSEKTIENEKPQKAQLETSHIQDSSLMGTQSLNKSRDTLKLPNIGDVSKNFGDKIYEKQSSATLQKSILVFSVPKAPRFGSGPKYAGEPSYYVDTCFKPNSTKGVGFGFGNKRQFPEWLEKNMKENPAPGAYFYQSKPVNSPEKKLNLTSNIHTRGPSFGISYKFYEKVTIPKEKSPQKTTISNQRLKPIFRSN